VSKTGDDTNFAWSRTVHAEDTLNKVVNKVGCSLCAIFIDISFKPL